MDDVDITLDDLCLNAAELAGERLNAQTPAGKLAAAAGLANGGELEVRVRLGAPCVVRVLLFNQAGQSVELGSTAHSITRGH